MNNVGKAVGKFIIRAGLCFLSAYATYRLNGGPPIMKVYNEVKRERMYNCSENGEKAEKMTLNESDFTVV